MTWDVPPVESLTAVRELLESDGERVREARGDVGRSETEQFPVGVDVVTVLDGVGTADGDGVGESDQGDAGRGEAEPGPLAEGDPGQGEPRQAGRDVTDRRDAVIAEAEQHGGDVRDDHDDHARRNLRHKSLDEIEHGEQAGRQPGGAARTLAEALDQVPDLREEAGRRDLYPENLADLADDDDQRDAVDVADEDGLGQEIGHESEPEQAGHDLDRTDRQRERRGQGSDEFGMAGGDRQDGGRGQR